MYIYNAQVTFTNCNIHNNRLLTVEKRACGGAPERLEGRVRLESLREVFCALLTELVVLEPVSEKSECQRLSTVEFECVRRRT